MLNRMRLAKNVESTSISTLENNIKLSPELRSDWRVKSFKVPGMVCHECDSVLCEAIVSTISRNVLFIKCLMCGKQW